MRIATLPDGTDPDSLIASQGADALRAVLDRAQPGFQHYIHEVWVHSARSADGRAAVIEDAARVLQKVANSTKRDLITGTLASAMGVDPQLVRRAMNRRNVRAQAPHAASPRSQPQPAPESRSAPPPNEELELLAIFADHPELVTTVDESDVVSLLTDARLRDMYCAVRQGASVLEAAPFEIKPLVAKHVLKGSYANVTDPGHCLADIMSQLRTTRRRRQLHALQHEAEQAKRRGDTERERELVHAIYHLRKQDD